ncbi:MAG: NADH-quinone oxidoreductase subunit NuoE [Nitrospiraceae bacterium]|nr:MAG: NADH-quinone oxidoreductase subunit NuoE [Nitrospiraceae bacterium]
MLTEEERKEIRDELKRHAHKQAACVEALKIVQRHRGWVSDEVRDIAELLEMTPDELDGVATFYSQIFRRPAGKHVIRVCDGVSCWVMGYDIVRRHLKVRLGIDAGETSSDGQFTLLPISCLGACNIAPAMMIDDELYGNLTFEKIDGILEKYR